MKALSAIAVAALAIYPGVLLAASDTPPGAAACSGCHTTNAAVESPVPRIHGRNANEIVTAMTAFRTGATPSTVMGRIAKGFTDEEMQPIAAWLAAQK
ncbi:MAG: cytochrome C [Pseudolabrys sp.]|nr:cytochrome C [Pseudolabrys sp.]MSP32017.1 cytochrome C [Pseudolabrys sp.]